MRYSVVVTMLLGILLSMVHFSIYAQESFSAWLEAVRAEAKVAGISDSTIDVALNHISLRPNVIALDHAQPEFVSPFLRYYQKRVDEHKVKVGRKLLSEHEVLLNNVEAQYGVPRNLIIAFWGLETQYGNYQGNTDTLSALATLAFDGRRADFFRAQLLDAMRIVDARHVTVETFKGSWAGAFGHMQFMPSTFMRYAVDGDNNGAIDIAHSIPDAFSSAAHYLSSVGWRVGEPITIEVQLPQNFAWQEAQLNQKKSIQEWMRLGVRALRIGSTAQNTPATLADAAQKKSKKHLKRASHKRLIAKKSISKLSSNIAIYPLNEAVPNLALQAAIVLPQGWQGPAFMVFDNFEVILDWNRSVNYALAVAQLAKRLNQESAIAGGTLVDEVPLSFQQMLALQSILNNKGFDPGTPDGLPGLKTQAAIRAYQLTQNLPADGYASVRLYQQLLSQAD